jgi:hypothetical protein
MDLKAILEGAGQRLDIAWESLVGFPELSQIPQELEPYLRPQDVGAPGDAQTEVAAIVEAVPPQDEGGTSDA